MNVVIYARYSSSSQREVSIEQQIEVCKKYAEQNGYTIIKVYSDKAMTGKNDNRPQFQKLLSDCEKHLFDGVLVYSLNRFGRNMKQTLDNSYIIEKNGKCLLSATEPFDNTPSGKFMRNIFMTEAQFYSDELSEKILRGMNYNAERCLYNGGGVPLGYKIGKDKRFEIDPDTAPIVQSIFKMYADGKTVTEINNLLNSKGYKTSKGVAFNKNSLHTILNNRRYLGYYIHCGYEIAGGIPQIISNELYEQVSDKLKKNKKAPARAKAKVEYLLTTKLFCGHSKDMMTGFSGTGKQGKVYRYYICNGTKKRPKTCNKKRVNKDYIENLVISECRRLLSAENIRRITKEVVAMSKAEKDNSNLKHLQKLLAENKRKQKNTINAIMESEIESVRKVLGEQIPILKNEHKVLEKQIAIEAEPYQTLSEASVRYFLTSLKKGNINDMKYRKMLIDIFVNKIYLYDDRITITYNSGDEPVTISDKLLSELEEKDEEDKFLFLNGSDPPIEYYTKPFYYVGGFTVTVGFVVTNRQRALLLSAYLLYLIITFL